MKRFWTLAAPLAQDGAFRVQLDKRLVKMPSGAPLSVASLKLAEAIA